MAFGTDMGSSNPITEAIGSPDEGGDSVDRLQVHMKAFIRAVQSGNTSRAAEAFRAAQEACMGDDYEVDAETER